MNRSSTSAFLEEAVGLLVQHFGVGPVRDAFAKVSRSVGVPSEHPASRAASRPHHEAKPNVKNILDQLRQKDADRYRLLVDFYSSLKDKEVLPESQDIRHFAQLIGLKKIGGKSRKELVSSLMRFLLEQPTERLRTDIRRAANVSEQDRREGFSVLTDKLLGNK